MERRYYKAINFDLDTVRLREYYPRYQQAYNDLLRFFKSNGFYHRQGSGYVSKDKLNSGDVMLLMEDFRKTFSWSSVCVKKIDVTNVGSQYDLVPALTPNEEADSFEL